MAWFGRPLEKSISFKGRVTRFGVIQLEIDLENQPVSSRYNRLMYTYRETTGLLNTRELHQQDRRISRLLGK